MNEMITPNKWALLPLVVFLVLFIGAGIFYDDFYKFPILIAALIALIFAAIT
ncbi:MAG TPA: sodium:proton antiporter, partial [Exiguobacterium sp.]|nr:sodium:proton antiporter [Exiguobacterium sp.]